MALKNISKKKNPHLEQLTSSFNKWVNKKTLLTVSALYIGTTLGFNAIRAIDVNNDIGDTVDRSAATYFAMSSDHLDETVTLNISEISSVGSSSQITLKPEAFNKVKAAYEATKNISAEWKKQADDIIEDVREEEVHFTFTYSWNGEGAKLLEVADRYNVNLVPAPTANSLPNMAINLDNDSKFKTIIQLPPQWDNDKNTLATKSFLEMIREKEQSLSTDLVGNYVFANINGQLGVHPAKSLVKNDGPTLNQ
jgi:hypothetical protein